MVHARVYRALPMFKCAPIPLRVLRRKQRRRRLLHRRRPVAAMDHVPNDVKEWLQGGGGATRTDPDAWDKAMNPCKFFDAFAVSGLRLDLVAPGRVVCTFQVPPRLAAKGSDHMHSGAVATLVDLVGSAVFYSGESPTTGVSLEINVSNFDVALVHEEIEIEAKVLQLGRAVGVAMVELRKKKTGKLIAQGRHAKYLAVSAKL